MPNLTQPELDQLISECILDERRKILNWLNEGYPIDHKKNEDCVCISCYKRRTLQAVREAIQGDNIVIHCCDYAQQPDIRIYCDQSYDNPDLSEPSPGAYGRYDGKIYTFDSFRVNCKDCLVKMKKNDPHPKCSYSSCNQYARWYVPADKSNSGEMEYFCDVHIIWSEYPPEDKLPLNKED